MLSYLKNWFVNAVANGGGLLIVLVLLVGGVGGAVAHDPISDFLRSAPALRSTDPNAASPREWPCPDGSWAYNSGYAPDIGSVFATCSKNKVIIRHFFNTNPGVKQDAFQDQGVYPFVDLETLEEAVRIANDR